MRVTVLGAGSWGTTVASLAARRNESLLWARDDDVAREVREEHRNSRYLGFDLPRRLGASSDLEAAVSRAQVLVVGVPSHAFRDTLKAARPYVNPWIPIISLTKGLEQRTLLRMTEVIKEVLPGHPAAALTGPNLAKEIMAGQAAASVVATEDLAVARALQGILQTGLFRIYVNDDVIGCEIGGALKNVIAISAGMAQGLGVGDNTRSAVIARGLAELTRLGVAMGGDAMTFAGLTGLGDLVATCVSPHSRNRYVGEQLGAGRTLEEILEEMNMVAEGVKTAASVMQLAKRYELDLPICRQVHRVVLGEISGSEAYRGLQPAGHEHDPG